VATFWLTGSCCHYKQPDITCITADSADVNRSHCAGRWIEEQEEQSRSVTRHARAPCDPRYPKVGGAVEGDCNLIPASPWHQDGRRSTGSWPPATDDAPPPAGSDNNSQLLITLMFLRISLSLKLTERASWFVIIGRNSNNILSTNVSINQTGPKLVSHHHHHHFFIANWQNAVSYIERDYKTKSSQYISLYSDRVIKFLSIKCPRCTGSCLS